MTTVGITGAAGRMGRTLVEAIDAAEGITLGGALERADSPELGRDAGALAGFDEANVAIVAQMEEAFAAVDVIIDFSIPQATLALLDYAVAQGKGLVIGTTGFSDEELQRIETASQSIAIMKAPNMSVGVNVTLKLLAMAAQKLGDDVDIEIIEAHHRHKIDAPSGTALRMGEVVADALGRDLAKDAIYGREGITGARERSTIAFSTIRGGDIVGDHTVMFIADGERIEIAHKSSSRMTFARGAVRAAGWLRDQEAGLFDMDDVLGFE